MHRNCFHLRRAFTMLELSVVLIVLAITAGAMLYPASTTLAAMRQASAVSEVERRITAARARAIAEGRPVGVYVSDAAVNGAFTAVATAAGLTATPHSVFPVDLASITSGGVEVSAGDVDQASKVATYSIATAFGGTQIQSISGTATGLIFFASDGVPEVRGMSGTRTGPLTSDIDILMDGGKHIYIRAGSGLVEVQ